MNTVKALGVGVVSAGIILFVAVVGYNLLALRLGTVSGDYFMGATAVAVLFGALWLISQGLGVFGKPFLLGAMLVLATINLKHCAPGVSEVITQKARDVDHKAHTAALNIAAPREIPCDSTTTTLKFFLGGKPAVWLSEDENRRIICWDRPGQHPMTNKELVEVDERFAGLIRKQAPTVQVPAQTATAIPPSEPGPRPTPLPVLDEFKIGDETQQ